ncbi:hypothetical protein KC220_27850, partial [Mycobacterium tuberculosis]|nr:hypothetical protein [Mycobacterium tuberculosis]
RACAGGDQHDVGVMRTLLAVGGGRLNGNIKQCQKIQNKLALRLLTICNSLCDFLQSIKKLRLIKCRFHLKKGKYFLIY